MESLEKKYSYEKEGFDKEIHYPPLLFVITADLLQYIINKAMFLGILAPPVGDLFSNAKN
jgi:hypothetical protein